MAQSGTDNQRATLSDLINYKPEQYLSDGELSLIRNTFKNNNNLLRALRKVLLPSMDLADLPIEELGKDLWNVGREWAQIPNEEAKALIVARQDAIKFIAGGLIQLKMLANTKEETPAEGEMRRTKDSLK